MIWPINQLLSHRFPEKIDDAGVYELLAREIHPFLKKLRDAIASEPLYVEDLGGVPGVFNNQQVFCNSYYSTNTIGGGWFRWDATSVATENGGTVIGSFSKGRWRRIFDRDIHAEWFGVKADGVTDDIVCLQKSADYCMSNGGKLLLPCGEMVISKTLHLSVNNNFSSILVEGSGRNYADGGLFFNSVLIATFSDAPAVNINGARITTFVDVSVRGLAYDYISGRELGIADTIYSDTTASDWEDPSLSSNAYKRYTPYAAVCVDGWSGSRPATHYPETDRAYGQQFSSEVTIRVMVQGFEVGVAVQPCDADGNGDFIKADDCYFKFCKYSVSIGNSQARNNSFDNCIHSQVHRCFTTSVHGRQNGKLHSVIKNNALYVCNGIIELGNSTGISGPVIFLSLYAETLFVIGEFGTGVSSSTQQERSLVFDTCDMGFHAQVDNEGAHTTDPERGIPGKILFGGTTPVVVEFRNCTLRNFPSVIVLDHSSVALYGCSVRSETRNLSSVPKTYLALAHNATCGGLVFSKLRSSSSNKIHFRQFNLDTLVSHGGIIGEDVMTHTSRPFCIPAWINFAGTSSYSTSSGYRDIMPVPRFTRALLKTSFVSVSLSQGASEIGTLTLEWSALSDATADHDGHNPGDVIIDGTTGMVFFIRSRSGVTVVAEAQNNYKWNGTEYTTITAFDSAEVGGVLYFLNSRIYTATYPVIADLTSASNVLTAVGRADGFATFLTADVIAGDRILIDQYADYYATSSTTSLITGVDAGLFTITLTSNVSRSESRKRIPFFIRAAPASTGSR